MVNGSELVDVLYRVVAAHNSAGIVCLLRRGGSNGRIHIKCLDRTVPFRLIIFKGKVESAAGLVELQVLNIDVCHRVGATNFLAIHDRDVLCKCKTNGLRVNRSSLAIIALLIRQHIADGLLIDVYTNNGVWRSVLFVFQTFRQEILHLARLNVGVCLMRDRVVLQASVDAIGVVGEMALRCNEKRMRTTGQCKDCGAAKSSDMTFTFPALATNAEVVRKKLLLCHTASVIVNNGKFPQSESSGVVGDNADDGNGLVISASLNRVRNKLIEFLHCKAVGSTHAVKSL